MADRVIRLSPEGSNGERGGGEELRDLKTNLNL